MRSAWSILLLLFLVLVFAEVSFSGEDRFSFCLAGSCSVESGGDMNALNNYPVDLNHTCAGSGQYALTFDDGPGHHWDEVLRILEGQEVKATFFVVGLNTGEPEQREMLRKAFAAGHQIANHGWAHPYLTELADGKVLEEVKSVRDRIVEVLGEGAAGGADYVRPPFGRVDPRVGRLLDREGFVTLRWNSDRYDWQLGADEGAVVLERLGLHLAFNKGLGTDVNRSILDLNHLGSKATISVLPDMIAMIRSAGYDFVTVRECLDGSR